MQETFGAQKPEDLELASVHKNYENVNAVKNVNLTLKAGTYCCLLVNRNERVTLRSLF